MTAYALTLLLLLPGLDVITVLKWENNSKNALLIMGSLSVAYYTIAPISLDLLRPALLSETKKRGVVLRGGYDPPTKDYKSSVLPIKLPKQIGRLLF